MSGDVFILGAWQSDFAAAAGGELYPLIESAALESLDDAELDPTDVDVAHVSNVGGELFCFQAHLGGMVAGIDPAFVGLPTSRHEAACASGSVAVLAAMADIEAGRYDVALVVGVDVLRHVGGERAGALLGVDLWSSREAVNERFPWPAQFGEMSLEYERRYGIDHLYLERIGELNYDNGRRNPNAQTRDWSIPADWFSDDDRESNPLLHGLIRKHDCGRITDGSASVVLASSSFAGRWARRHGAALSEIPRIKGWGHRTAPLLLSDKLKLSHENTYMFPHLKATVDDALQRAGLPDAAAASAIELHDCFTFSEYMILDHLGLAEPGNAWQLISDGTIDFDGSTPVNPSGGLLAGGHPVGATGVRIVVDAARQVTDRAGEYQVPGADNVLTINLGGSCTTVASFVVGRAQRP